MDFSLLQRMQTGFRLHQNSGLVRRGSTAAKA